VPDHEPAAAFIERIVAGARIPSRAGREDLRRELWTHFEEAGASIDAVDDAISRFGAEGMVIAALRRVYRWDYLAVYVVKIAASIAASIAAALLIELLVNLRVDTPADAWRLAPGFSFGVGPAVGVVLALVAAREIARRPFDRRRAALAVAAYAAVCALAQWLFVNGGGALVTATLLVALGYACSTLETRAVKWLATFAVFAAAEYGLHLLTRAAFGPSRAVLAGAVLLAVWTSTAVILGRVDHAFTHFFEAA
jgi:hypothetical protein